LNVLGGTPKLNLPLLHAGEANLQFILVLDVPAVATVRLVTDEFVAVLDYRRLLEDSDRIMSSLPVRPIN
jgi:hypothetical protein